jgi:hypothetical protein
MLGERLIKRKQASMKQRKCRTIQPFFDATIKSRGWKKLIDFSPPIDRACSHSRLDFTTGKLEH